MLDDILSIFIDEKKIDELKIGFIEEFPYFFPVLFFQNSADFHFG
jgi:hypothetical protein